MTTTQDDADLQGLLLSQLRDWLGDDFMDWALAGGTPPITPAQREVAAILHQACSEAASQHGVLPARFLVSGLLGFDAARGMSTLNALRIHAGGELPALPPPSGDAVLDALGALAIEVYSELLLPEDAGRLAPGSSLVSPAAQRAMESIKEDPGLPFGPASGVGDSISLLSSTGRGGGFQLAFLGPALVGHAWELARLRDARPTAEALLREIPAAVAAARAAFTGNKTTATGLVSLTGVLLPSGSELTFTWGRLRPARESDHPRGIRRALGDRSLTQRSENETEIVITDVGDIVLEVSVPFAVRVGEEFDPAVGFPDLSSRHELEMRIMQVRLALLLSSADPQPPVLLPVWQRFIEPLAPTGVLGWRDPQHFAARTPTQLTPDQTGEWSTWIERLDAIPPRRLGVAPQRLLRATAERRDVSDSLVDAVIAWESLFGAETEATLRVSAAIARLLHPVGEDRRRLRSRIGDIYRLRSKVVHGAEADVRDVAQASQEAASLAADVLRILIADRQDLLRLTSAERSTAILME